MLRFLTATSTLFLILTNNSWANNAPQQGGLVNFIPLILILLVFYFLLFRPQQKKFKEHQETLKSLKTGNKVVTSSGIIGVVRAIDNKENIVDLEISSGVVMQIQKHNINGVVKEEKKRTNKNRTRQTRRPNKTNAKGGTNKKPNN